MTDRRPAQKSHTSPAVRRMANRLDEILREIDSAATLAAELVAKTGTERAAAVRTEVRFHGLKLWEFVPFVQRVQERAGFGGGDRKAREKRRREG